jgi:hypothetical protein
MLDMNSSPLGTGMSPVIYHDAVDLAVGMVDAYNACVCKHIIVSLYLLFQPFGDASYAQLRIDKSVCECRYILSGEFKKSILDGLRK